MTHSEPELTEVDTFLVAGMSVRTINQDEFNPTQAKLPQLWNQFFSTGMAEKIPNKVPDSSIFGVYSNYASDATDFYTVTAGVSVDSAIKTSELNTVSIDSGHYLVFKDKGLMPDVIIRTWERIWIYFEGHNKPKRRFGSDFEVFLSSDEIAIYIGIIS